MSSRGLRSSYLLSAFVERMWGQTLACGSWVLGAHLLVYFFLIAGRYAAPPRGLQGARRPAPCARRTRAAAGGNLRTRPERQHPCAPARPFRGLPALLPVQLGLWMPPILPVDPQYTPFTTMFFLSQLALSWTLSWNNLSWQLC